MNIAVCEDVAEEAGWLCEKIKKWAYQEKKPLEVQSFPDAASFLFAMEDTIYDALFLDIRMPGENGMALARRLREKENEIPIVFVTGEKEYMLEGYEVEAVHYLVKPVDVEKLFACLERIYGKVVRREPSLFFDSENGRVKLLQRDIYLLEVYSHQVIYVTRKGEYRRHISLKDALSEMKGNSFSECYRGIAVNLYYVESIGKTSLSLCDEVGGFQREIPVSRRLYHSVNEAFLAFYRGEIL